MTAEERMAELEKRVAVLERLVVELSAQNEKSRTADDEWARFYRGTAGDSAK